SGAAGFLGSHFLLWRAPGGGRLFALARGRDGVGADARVRQAVACARSSYPALVEADTAPSFVTVTSELTDSQCGVSAEDLRMMKSAAIREFWHFGANLGFENRRAEQIRRTNVEGTRNAVALAAAVGVTEFFYVSTAYVSGTRSGQIEEVLSSGSGEFCNHYEESKSEAEREVVARCAEWGIRCTILRPSVVVGPRASRMPGGSQTGLYGLVATIARLRTLLAKQTGDVSLGFDGDTHVNLLPVDDMLARFFEIASQRPSSPSVFHVVSKDEVTTRDIVAAIRRALELPNLNPGGQRRSGAVGRLLARSLVFFQGYLTSVRRFQTNHFASVGLTLDDLDQYVLRYIESLDMGKIDITLQKQPIVTFDGTRIHAYASLKQDCETIILVNAYAMPVDVLLPLIKRLASRWQVITWESRDVPLETDTFVEDNSGVEGQVKDLLAVMDHYGVQRAHVVGWCSGAQVGLEAAAATPERVLSLSTLSASFGFPSSSKTEFETKLLSVVPAVSGDRDRAQMVSEMLFSSEGGGGAGPSAASLVSLAGIDDPTIAEMAAIPFKSGEGLYRYSNFVTRLYSRPELQDWSAIRVPFNLFVNEGNSIAHPKSSDDLARKVPHAVVERIAGNDHFNVYHQPDLIAERLIARLQPSTT
ncbi:alpha/beta fold hydrolase, partial [Myxococcota bacterium]